MTTRKIVDPEIFILKYSTVPSYRDGKNNGHEKAAARRAA